MGVWMAASEIYEAITRIEWENEQKKQQQIYTAVCMY